MIEMSCVAHQWFVSHSHRWSKHLESLLSITFHLASLFIWHHLSWRKVSAILESQYRFGTTNWLCQQNKIYVNQIGACQHLHMVSLLFSFVVCLLQSILLKYKNVSMIIIKQFNNRLTQKIGSRKFTILSRWFIWFFHLWLTLVRLALNLLIE